VRLPPVAQKSAYEQAPYAPYSVGAQVTPAVLRAHPAMSTSGAPAVEPHEPAAQTWVVVERWRLPELMQASA